MSRADWTRLVLLSLLWGGSFLFVEVALGGLPVLTIVWLRVALAAAMLTVCLLVLRLPFAPRPVWSALLVMGLMNNAVPFTLFALAQGQISGALASVLNATTPLFTVIVAHLTTKDERINGAKTMGLCFGFAGVIVMMVGADGLEGTLSGAGLAKLACLSAALSYGIAGVWGLGSTVPARRAGPVDHRVGAGYGVDGADFADLALGRCAMGLGLAWRRGGGGCGRDCGLFHGAGVFSVFPAFVDCWCDQSVIGDIPDPHFGHWSWMGLFRRTSAGTTSDGVRLDRGGPRGD
jgi:drug/metabolite transporter (DMT)-like permease